MENPTAFTAESQLPAELIDFDRTEVFQDDYYEQGITPYPSGRRHHWATRPEITDLLTQHHLLSDGEELRRAILARSGEAWFIHQPCMTVTTNEAPLVAELREIKTLLLHALTPYQGKPHSLTYTAQEAATPAPLQTNDRWIFEGVPDETN
jgi:hypothetical protein